MKANLKALEPERETTQKEIQDIIMVKLNRLLALLRMIEKRNSGIWGLGSKEELQDAIDTIDDTWSLAKIAVDEITETFDMVDSLKLD